MISLFLQAVQHGDCQIPNMYNKTSVDLLVADIYNDTYLKTEMGTLFEDIDFSNSRAHHGRAAGAFLRGFLRGF